MGYERAGYSQQDPTSHKSLLANSDDITTRKITVLSGQVQPAGAVMGKITASSKLVLSLSASSDGSQTPEMILAEDVDATAGDVEAIAYETVTVNAAALKIGSGHTLAGIREGLRGKGIKIDD